MDWAEFAKRRKKAPATARVPLCADREALSELEAARASRDPKVREKIPELQEAVTAQTMHVTLRELGAEEYVSLKEAHRPTDSEKLKRGDEWDEATFGPALIAACIDPPLTEEEAAEWWKDGWTLAERAQLFITALNLNETVPDLDFTRPGTG